MNGSIKSTADTQIEIALGTLLDSVIDKSSLVSETITAALQKIANKYPNDVLRACCHFGLRKDPKPSPDHIGTVLSIMESICREHIIYIDGDAIMLSIELCLELMTQNVLPDPIIQMPASSVLVALGTKHCIQVIDGLMNKMTEGVVPHYTIPHTLGSISSANAYGIVPYLKKILTILLPLLPGLKVDVVKQAFAYSLGKFSEAIIEYTSNPEQAPDPTITIDDFQGEISAAYDVLFSVWVHSKEPKLVEIVLHALAAMFHILSIDKIRQHTNKSIQVLLALYRYCKS